MFSSSFSSIVFAPSPSRPRPLPFEFGPNVLHLFPRERFARVFSRRALRRRNLRGVLAQFLILRALAHERRREFSSESRFAFVFGRLGAFSALRLDERDDLRDVLRRDVALAAFALAALEQIVQPPRDATSRRICSSAFVENVATISSPSAYSYSPPSASAPSTSVPSSPSAGANADAAPAPSRRTRDAPPGKTAPETAPEMAPETAP